MEIVSQPTFNKTNGNNKAEHRKRTEQIFFPVQECWQDDQVINIKNGDINNPEVNENHNCSVNYISARPYIHKEHKDSHPYNDMKEYLPDFIHKSKNNISVISECLVSTNRLKLSANGQ